jgi:hypothetical protein
MGHVMSDDIKKPLTFTIEACPTGYQVSTRRTDVILANHRTKTYIGAKWWVWRYQRRLKRLGQA